MHKFAGIIGVPDVSHISDEYQLGCIDVRQPGVEDLCEAGTRRAEVIELNGYDPDIDLFNYSIVYLNEGEKS